MNSEPIIQNSELRRAVSLCFVAAALWTGASAQDIVFRPDPAPAGARGGALGGALVSDNHDIEGLYSNTATLREMPLPGITIDHRHDWDQGIFYEDLALRLFSSDYQALGAGFRVTDGGSYGPRRLFDFTQYAADIGYAFDVIPNLHLGILGGGRIGEASGDRKTGYSVSLGVLYSPTPSVSYGFAVRDLGKSLQYLYSPNTGRTTVGLTTTSPATLETGGTFRFPAQNRMPYLQISVAIERDYGTRNLWYKGGIELTPWPFLAARVGYINETVVQGTGGLGLTIGNFRFDYAIMPRKQASRYDEFSIKAFF